MKTNFKDKNGIEIKLGDKVKYGSDTYIVVEKEGMFFIENKRCIHNLKWFASSCEVLK